LEPPVDAAEWQLDPPAWHADPRASEPAPKFQNRLWVHIGLFALTIVTTTVIGGVYYGSFITGFSNTTPEIPLASLLLHGFWYSGTVIAILGSHEMGHYLACRYYNIDASLPYFLPVPLFPSGTLGAFIRIREPIPLKRMLFDIGIAGPIAGFLVAVPALFIGISMSHVVAMPDPMPEGTTFFGEPLLFQLATKLFFGTIPHGYDLNTHPVAFGAWFGLLATFLNLFPIGQLDGGHISYSVLGRKSSIVSMVGIAAGVILSFFARTWIVWTVLMIVMLRAFGRHHPRVYDEDTPLDRTRLALAGFALLMFIVCFMPEPLR
jgi:membrane-associated protease RseP (regulator of RpoE activity)